MHGLLALVIQSIDFCHDHEVSFPEITLCCFRNKKSPHTMLINEVGCCDIEQRNFEHDILERSIKDTRGRQIIENKNELKSVRNTSITNTVL